MTRMLTASWKPWKRVGTTMAGLGVVLCGGCLINSGSEQVVEADAKRVSVEFESEQAMATFQRAVKARYAAGGGVVSKSGLAIPFVIAAGNKKVLSENAFYNGEVAKADVNGDGRVSDAEARVYAQ